MRAKSDTLALQRAERETAPRAKRPVGESGAARMPKDQRRAQILEKAAEFFAEYGLTAQTRGLAEACGISQRLLYRFFPTKAALIEEVYRSEIVGPFKAVWFAQLADRSKPVEARLLAFYRDYYQGVLTRRWLRLFLYASLAEIDMAPSYISAIVTQLLEIILEEAAHEQGLALPGNRSLGHEIAWTLHGAVSHLAIRRHLYHVETPLPPDEVVALHVRSFLGGLPALLPARA